MADFRREIEGLDAKHLQQQLDLFVTAVLEECGAGLSPLTASKFSFASRGVNQLGHDLHVALTEAKNHAPAGTLPIAVLAVYGRSPRQNDAMPVIQRAV